jgi:hypothetical protein
MAIIGQFCLSFKSFYRILELHFWNAVVALLDKPDLGKATKRGRTVSALLDNASVKVMQDDSSLLSELHMGLSLIR